MLQKYHKKEDIECKFSEGWWLIRGLGRTSPMIFFHYCIDKLLDVCTTYPYSLERHMVFKIQEYYHNMNFCNSNKCSTQTLMNRFCFLCLFYVSLFQPSPAFVMQHGYGYLLLQTWTPFIITFVCFKLFLNILNAFITLSQYGLIRVVRHEWSGNGN